MTQKILIVDDEKKIRNILTHILADEQYDTAACANGEDALDCVDTWCPDLILMDQNMPGMDGIETMIRIREKYPSISVIILTAFGSIPLAVKAMKSGAYNYITKPFDNEELLIAVRRALEHKRLNSEIARLREELKEKYRFENIIGSSSPMIRLFEQMMRVCDNNATVLIQGESGTGKELVAKAIHYHSKRKDYPLVSVNCGAVPFNLIESEFFGHEKGAFTDAKERKQGSFERAHGGTLFLDEIGELPVAAQVKLLRVLEDRTITRVGGKDSIPVDVRIIAATNKILDTEVQAGNFRLDLLYRLNIFTITIPPLRERPGDIALLVEYFISKHNKLLGLDIKNITREAMDIFGRFDWPGNVRDIENAVQSAMILATGETIDAGDLPLRVRGYADNGREPDIEREGLESYIQKQADQMEKRIIIDMLNTCSGNRTETAQLLKVSRKTLFNKMKKYGLE